MLDNMSISCYDIGVSGFNIEYHNVIHRSSQSVYKYSDRHRSQEMACVKVYGLYRSLGGSVAIRNVDL